MADWLQRRVIEQARALRRLPPGTILPEPTSQLDRALLADLRNLDGEANPIRWLEENHGERIARVLLWTILNRLKVRAWKERREQRLWYDRA